VKALVLAAGLGTRLRPVTRTIPKPLVPLCNKPLIGWAIDELLAAGIDELIVNLHHLPAPLQQFVSSVYTDDARLHFSFEKEILGTGGAVRRVRALLEEDADFFVVNADTVQRAPYVELKKKRREADALAALTLRHPPEGDRFTSVWLDRGRVTGFGSGSGEALMFSGAHLVSRRIFEYLPDREFSGIVEDAYMPVLDAARETLSAVVDDGIWFDVGNPARYLAAHRGLLAAMSAGGFPQPAGSLLIAGSLLHSTASVRGRVAGSAIGAGSVIEGEVRESAVWEGCHIGPGVRLERCIVSHGVHLVTAGEFRGMVICRDDPSIPDEDRGRPDVLVV
jgi:NDP-sugar pyrophosphorylase family protein